MLNDARGFRRIIIACGKTDLRRGVDGLIAIIQEKFQMDPGEKDVLVLFCGTRSDRIKGLVFEGDGYLLLYKRLSNGKFQWPRNQQEAMSITQEQFDWLMRGMSIPSTPLRQEGSVQHNHRTYAGGPPSVSRVERRPFSPLGGRKSAPAVPQ